MNRLVMLVLAVVLLVTVVCFCFPATSDAQQVCRIVNGVKVCDGVSSYRYSSGPLYSRTATSTPQGRTVVWQGPRRTYTRTYRYRAPATHWRYSSGTSTGNVAVYSSGTSTGTAVTYVPDYVVEAPSNKIRQTSTRAPKTPEYAESELCPYCGQTLPEGFSKS